MTPAGTEPATFRFVEQHLNHCATAVERKVDFFKFKPGGICDCHFPLNDQLNLDLFPSFCVCFKRCVLTVAPKVCPISSDVVLSE